MILSVHHAQLTVPLGQEDAAREFYCGFLGLTEVPKPTPLKERGGFWIQLGSFQIHVGTEDGIPREKSKAHLAYLVDDLEAYRSKLAKLGVAAIDGREIPGYRRFEFRDPFGNRVEFLQAIETNN
jgi:catechol 2,3-dioxygenase-like lactoylglutathione lyase family enzyme